MTRSPDVETSRKLTHPELKSRKGCQEFLRLLDTNGYKMAWRQDKESEKEKFVIARPNGSWPKMPPSVPESLARCLGIESKESWSVEKDAAGV